MVQVPFAIPSPFLTKYLELLNKRGCPEFNKVLKVPTELPIEPWVNGELTEPREFPKSTSLF